MTAHQHPPEDRTGQPGFVPADGTQNQTMKWRIRSLVQTIRQLLEQIDAHPQPRGDIVAMATAIREDFTAVTAGGSVSAAAEPWLRAKLGELQELLLALTGTITTPVESPAAAPTDTDDAGGDGWALPTLIRQERGKLTPPASPWPWRDRANRRRWRAWLATWRLIQDHPVDRDRVQQAWARYQSLTTRPPALLEPSTTATPEGTQP